MTNLFLQNRGKKGQKNHQFSQLRDFIETFVFLWNDDKEYYNNDNDENYDNYYNNGKLRMKKHKKYVIPDWKLLFFLH